MEKLDLKDFVQRFSDSWLDELIMRGRAFPDFRDGLKDSTRSILTALARASKFESIPVGATSVIGDVSSYKEGGELNVAKNLFRMTSSNTPLISVVAKDNQKARGLNRISGGYSQPRYVSLSLTPLGKYVFKYRKYFSEHQSEVQGSFNKYDYIKTPVPLSLLIPQVNLSDGFSNKAPNLNILQVLNAYIEHIQKDKNTTTEDLAKHIKGFELTPGSKVLMSNQSLYDLIERGVSKATVISPVKFYEGEIIIAELPYRAFGKTIMEEFNKLHVETVKKGSKGNGFKSFAVTAISGEDSEESMITVNYTINPGYTIKDVKTEIYAKTSLKERLVYENLCLDFTQEKPLTIKSIRQVLDYHVDLGLELKEQEIKDMILELEEQRSESEFLEKLTRKICVDIIGRIIGESKRGNLAEKYLNSIYEIMKESLLGTFDLSRLKDYTHIEDVIIKSTDRLKALSVKKYGNEDEESLIKILDEEVPVSFSRTELDKIFLKQYEVLYNLNKRNKAIEILRTYRKKLKDLTDSMNKETLKLELIKEIEELKSKYKDATFSENLYALRTQEREERKMLKSQMINNIKRMEGEMPVNILIDKDMVARISIDPTDKVEGLKQVIQATTNDSLLIFNRKEQSYKIPVRDLTLTGTPLGNKDDILAVMVNEYNSPQEHLYVFVTNKGRVIICDRSMLVFINKKLNIPMDVNEHFVYYEAIPSALYSEKVSILLKTEDNKVKKRILSDFTVKSKFNEFFNLFADVSKTDSVTGATIVPTNLRAINLWSNGFSRIFYENGFKRNVSYGEDIPYNKTNSIITDDKIPHVNGEIITGFNTMLNEEEFNDLSPIMKPIDHKELNSRIKAKSVSDIEWAKLCTSSARKRLKLDFEPDEIQIKAFLTLFR